MHITHINTATRLHVVLVILKKILDLILEPHTARRQKKWDRVTPTPIPVQCRLCVYRVSTSKVYERTKRMHTSNKSTHATKKNIQLKFEYTWNLSTLNQDVTGWTWRLKYAYRGKKNGWVTEKSSGKKKVFSRVNEPTKRCIVMWDGILSCNFRMWCMHMYHTVRAMGKFN